MVEESMGLKPGLLTDPALEQMNKYYTQLAEQVDNIAKAAGVLDTVSDYSDSIGGKIVRFLAGDSKKLDVGPKLTSAPDLGVLMDDVFIQKRRSNQESRLNEARLGSEDKMYLPRPIVSLIKSAPTIAFTKHGPSGVWQTLVRVKRTL